MKFVRVTSDKEDKFTVLVALDEKTREPKLTLPTADCLRWIHELLILYSKKKKIDPPQRGLKYEGQLEFFEKKLIERHFSKKKYDNVMKISEDILFEIACRHPFIDGNKRTALLASNIFLDINMGWYIKKDKRCTKYVCKSDPNYALSRGPKIKLIASWNEEDQCKELRDDLIKNGIKIRRKVTEQHVRKFIRHFLWTNFIQEKK